MQQSISRIGILGGTFNPIHNGHLIIAETVRESCGLDKVLFIPSGQPPHKPGQIVIAAEHRYEMVCRAIASNRFFEASRVEIDRKGITYTVNTLEVLRNLYGREPRLFFIIGADVIPELATWRDFRRVFEMCEFIAVLRPGNDKAAFEKAIEENRLNYGAQIHMTEAPQVDISSSGIRAKCSLGKSVKYLVPEAVEEYIAIEGLYR